MNLVRELIRIEVATGYHQTADSVTRAVQWMFDDDPHLDEARAGQLVETLVREEIQAHLAAQADWPEVTDYDRLVDAFAELDSVGIVAREHFSCCGSCGAG